MSETFELDGEEYEMNGNPSLRTVREVQNMQMGMIMEYVEEEDLQKMDSVEDESEIIEAIMETGGYQALQDVMWERSMLEPMQTISLACDHVFDIDDLESLPANKFKSVKQDAEEALGGDASDFFEELGIGSYLNDQKIQEQAAEMQA